MTERGAQPCPICRALAADRYRPFCSARCADTDLYRWLTDRYAIPVSAEDEDAGEPAVAPDIPGQGGTGTL